MKKPKLIIALSLFIMLLIQPGFSKITWEPMWDGAYDSTKGPDMFPEWLVKDDDVSTWFLEDSSITVYDDGEPAVGSIWYKRVFTEGTFDISYKIHEGLNGNNNGGIYILGRPGGTQESDVNEQGRDLEIGTPNIEGMEVEMDGQHIGCLICNNCGFWMQHSPDEYNGIADKNDWIDLRIAVNGNNFRTWYRQTGEEDWITGIDYDHSSQITGRFGMEVYMGHLSFKNIKLAAGCSDPNSPRYDREEVENLGWVLDDNGSCEEENWGCKDSSFVDYNPDAKFEDSTKCENLAIRSSDLTSKTRIFTEKQKINVSISNIELNELHIYSVNGEKLLSRYALAPANHSFSFKPGLYLVEVKENGGKKLKKILVP